MGRFYTTPDGNIPFSQAEEDARDAEEAQAVLDKPAADWRRDMGQFAMSREMEEHYVNKHAGQTGDPYTQAILDAKKARRGQRRT